MKFTLLALLIFTKIKTKPVILMNFFFFKKLLYLPRTVLTILRQLKAQRIFLHSNIKPLLQDALIHNDGSLDETDFKKITHYYGLAVPAILGEAFCILQGRSMTVQERWASTCQGAMTGLFDDFFDKDYMDDTVLKKKIAVENKNIAQKSNEKLFDIFYEKALTAVPDKNYMQEALFAVYEAQVKSKQQTDISLTAEAIESITLEKGGVSLLFYRTAFLPHPAADEILLLYHLGGTMQLANDIFDVYKDREKNIRTLMTETRNVQSVRRLLTSRWQYASNEAYKLNYSPASVQQFLEILFLGIFSRCFVCLDQLEKIEKITAHQFNVQLYSRSQLVCDMDTNKNMLRSAAYSIKKIQ